MKRLPFLLIALLVVPSFGSFYFDLTLGVALRHLEAVQEQPGLDKSNSGCHFEPDGRYVCGEKSSGGKYGSYEKDIGYTGFGPLFSMRLGCLIKGLFAPFANIEFETGGKVHGSEKDEAKPRAAFLGGGPGVAIYPFSHSEGAAKNLYMVATANMLLGGAGDIVFLGVHVMFEAGYLFPVSERLNFGFAAGADLISPGDFDSDIKDESGFALWVGLKFVRK